MGTVPSRLLLLALVLAWLFGAAHAATPEHVLVLYSNGRPLPANAEFDAGMAEVLGERSDVKVSLSSEFLDFPNFSGEAYERTVAAYLHDKYAQRQPRLIIAGGDEALAFAVRQREHMFPGVPVLFAGVELANVQRLSPLAAGVFGVPMRFDFIEGVEQALRWRPHTRHLLVITGTSASDVEWRARVQEEAGHFDKRLAVEFVTANSTEALLQRLRALGGDWLVYTPGYFRDGDGQTFTPRKSAGLIATAATVPVIGPFSTFIGIGVLAGYVPQFFDMGRVTAHLALRVLGGEAPASIPVPATMPAALHIDWRQAQRFGIDSAELPPGTVVQFKEPGFWEQYRAQALTGAAVLLLQFLLIAALLFERHRRRRTAVALMQSEQRMSLAAQAAHLKMWVWDAGRAHVWTSTSAQPGAGQSAQSSTDVAHALDQVHPQDRERVGRAFEQALASGEPLEVEYRVLADDGEVRWQAARGRVEADQRLMGVALDISERKRAELQAEQDRAALRHLTRVSLLGQLSASIAHQLNQPLASILSNGEAAQLMLEQEPLDLEELRAICADIVAEDQRAAAVIRQLGALFKRGDPSLAPTDLNQLVRDTLELLRANLLSRQVQVELRLASALPTARGDRVQLQQLLLNLTINAADAMASLSADRRRIVLSTEARGSDIRICVADNGPGLSEADMDKLFEPFWSSKSDGMGIGLAISRSIAAAHQGTLVASNGRHGGAVFCLRLPVQASPVQPMARMAA
ncbi:MAG: ATP-binding protein [Rhizobacter sp.]|nr:ATP-binding protein [Rhizobacter sp.]